MLYQTGKFKLYGMILYWSFLSEPELSEQMDPVYEKNWAPLDKTNKMTVRPAKTQISLGIRPVWSEWCPVWSESWLSAWRKLGSLATYWAHSKDSDQTGQMPRLIWVFAWRTCHFVGFVMRRLIFDFTLTADLICQQTCLRSCACGLIMVSLRHSLLYCFIEVMNKTLKAWKRHPLGLSHRMRCKIAF